MARHFKTPEETGVAAASRGGEDSSHRPSRGEIARARRNELSARLSLTSGKKLVPNTLGTTTIRQRSDGMVYFGKDPEVLYRLVDLEWDGPRYKTVTRTETTGTSKGKSKRTGRLVGAVVGTMLLPGVGTVIGAGHGTGNKKTRGKTQSSSVSYDEEVEVAVPATLTLEREPDGKRIFISAQCKADMGNVLRSMLES